MLQKIIQHHREDWKNLIIASFLSVFLLIIDIITPFGYLEWIFYNIPLLFVLRTEKPLYIYGALILIALFFGIGLFLSPAGEPLHIMNRFFGYCAIFIFAIIIIKLFKTKKMLQEKTEALEKQTEELILINKELETFSYSVSHDLRSPVGAVKGFAEIVLEDFSAQLNGEVQNYLRLIVDSASKMNDLIDDLLTLSKISHENLNVKRINLSMIAGKIAANLKATDLKRIVDFGIENNVFACADEKLITIALENLFGNAWKFTSKNEKGIIVFGTKKEGNHQVYFVQDNGAGFDMKFVPKLFEPFQRLHSDSEFKGTGIGLAIVDRVIKKHGGNIWGEGKIGSGATFYFTLPVRCEQ